MFKIGDIVTGTPNSHIQYGVTNQNATLRVVDPFPEDYPDGYVILEVLSTMTIADKSLIGVAFTVQEKFFELVDPSLQGKTDIERKIAFMHNRWANRKN